MIAVATGKLCLQINPEYSNSAFINFSLVTEEFPEEKFLSFLRDEGGASKESTCFFSLL